MRPLSKIHGHSMERFSHWETGLDKYAISWSAYGISLFTKKVVWVKMTQTKRP